MTNRNALAIPSALFDRFRSHTIGFDDIFDRVFNAVDAQAKLSYPPYNVIKTSDNEFVVELAVAGFREDQLSVELESDKLVVAGSIVKDVAENVDESAGPKYAHKGIAERSFTRSWQLPEHTEVTSVTLKYGILTIALTRNVPAEKARKTFAIELK